MSATPLAPAHEDNVPGSVATTQPEQPAWIRWVLAWLVDYSVLVYLGYTLLYVISAAVSAWFRPSVIRTNPLLSALRMPFAWINDPLLTLQTADDGEVVIARWVAWLLIAAPLAFLATRTLKTPGRRALCLNLEVSPIPGAWRGTLYGTVWIIVALVTFMAGWYITDIRLVALFTNIGQVGRIGSRLLQPDLNVLPLAIERMIQSVFMALMATVLAVPIAIPLSFLGARNVMRGSALGMAIFTLTRTFFNIFRSFESLIFAILFIPVVGLGTFAGALAIWIHSIAALGKLYSEQIESIDPGPVEAIQATGASAFQTMVYAIWPQVVPPFLGFTFYRWDINVRMSIIVGFVGGGGIGLLLQQYTGLLRWSQVGTIAWLTVAVVWVVDYVSSKVREKLI